MMEQSLSLDKSVESTLCTYGTGSTDFSQLKRKFCSILLLILSTDLCAETEYDQTITNANYSISQGSIFLNEDITYTYNYNRLRYQGNWNNGNYFATVTGDMVNYLSDDYVNSRSFNVSLLESDTPFKTQTNQHNYSDGVVFAKIYRLYAGYQNEHDRMVIGLQNITMGVGRIWNPTNLFNPRNAYLLEPDEVFGVSAISYTRHINEASQVTAVISQKKDNSFKYALRYKAFIEFADIAVDLFSSNNTSMIGFEIEGNLADTGIELRSEGAYLKSLLATNLSQQEEKDFYQITIGADYGFKNGISLTLETHYSSDTFEFNDILLNKESEIIPNLVFSNLYAGATLTYSFNIFLDGSLVYIESFNTHNSRFISPTLTYTLNDYNKFVVGGMIQYGQEGSEFGILDNTYYFKWGIEY
jgi:hypothetical protein